MATKAKKSVKKKSVKNGKAHAATLPGGYKVIGRAPSWEHEKHPVLQGERGDIREVVMDKGTKKERTLRTMIVQDDTIGAVTVWESAMLADMMDSTEDGDNIRIEFLGYGQAKKGQNAPKLFSCAVKE